MTVYGQRLVEAMGRKNYNVKTLSDISGISASTIYYAMEMDTTIPSAFTLACLADALDVTMDWLWGRE